jgi:hypothetical protein
VARLRRLVSLLPWWANTLAEAMKPELDFPEPSEAIGHPPHMAALLAIGNVWMQYIAYIPPHRREYFKQRLGG